MATIFAVSSGAPPAALAILRLSGSEAVAAAERLCGRLPEPRHASLRALRDPDNGELHDRALVLFFPGPNSSTGEDVVEFHLHGGRAVVRAVEECLARQPDLRRAEAGEFTRRALMNGRIDLTEAEGLADLLSAETEAQRRAAIRSAEGGIRRQVAEWDHELLGLAAQVEAILDHGDEDDVVDDERHLAQLREAIVDLGTRMSRLLERSPVERLRDGIRVVLAGPPNAGKSTLLNSLAGREAAIVSDVAGTTRDRIEVPVLRNGVAWLFTDTAGLTETADPVERIGVTRSYQAIDTADVVIWLGDDEPPSVRNAIVVDCWARCDAEDRIAARHGTVPVSGMSSTGTNGLWDVLDRAADEMLPFEDDLTLNMRQRGRIRSATGCLSEAASHNDLVLVAEELRCAGAALAELTGASSTERLLDELFGRFCIGK